MFLKTFVCGNIADPPKRHAWSSAIQHFKPAVVQAAAGGKGMSFGKGVLPDATTMGALNTHTLNLELHCASRPGLEASLRGDGDNASSQVLAHELCHWTGKLSLSLAYSRRAPRRYCPRISPRRLKANAALLSCRSSMRLPRWGRLVH